MNGVSKSLEFGKGRMGSALMGSLQIACVCYGWTFWVLPLTYFYLPKSASAYLFPESVKNITFAAAPLVLTPFVRSQGMSRARGRVKEEPVCRLTSCPLQ